MSTNIAEGRASVLGEAFPGGVPPLWCPTITHYDSEGRIDSARMAGHFQHLAAHVKGFLIPGSTGDGWELTVDESQEVLNIALEQAQKFRVRLLVGVLKADVSQALEHLQTILKLIQRRGVGPDANPVAGFVVCAPWGKTLSQEEIGRQLASFLGEGLPTAIYQLPQVTQNEISPELAAQLAKRFKNFILFKDSSGTDRIVLSKENLEGAFTMRGAEGDYARWLKSGAGPYDGFLLSTANCFGAELSSMMDDLAAGRTEEGRKMSARLTGVVGEVFRLVAGLPDGNPFANANKAMDHFFAYGPNAAQAPRPRLHAGTYLSDEVIRATGEALKRHGFMPTKGYLG